MVPRIRTVKPELFKHGALFEAEQSTKLPLRLAFIGLFSCCDREGRFPWQPRRLKVEIFPYETLDFTAVLDALCQAGFIRRYRHQGTLYGCIPSWRAHQRINKKEPQSVFPSPEAAQALSSDALATPVTVKESSPPLEGQSSPSKDSKADQIAQAHAGTCLAPISTCGKEGKGTGTERNTEEEGDGSGSAPVARPSMSSQPIQQVFEHWKRVMHHPQAKLDGKRRRCIEAALKMGYSMEALREAIEGCSKTPHNQGHNDTGQRYDGLQVILKDADQIDRFRHNYHFPPRPFTEAERRLHANAQTLSAWMDAKKAEYAHAAQ